MTRVKKKDKAGKPQNRKKVNRRHRKKRRERRIAVLVLLFLLVITSAMLLGIWKGIQKYLDHKVMDEEQQDKKGDNIQEIVQENFPLDKPEDEDVNTEENKRTIIVQKRNKIYEDIPYCLYLPDQMEEGERYPLVLFLHGAGERGTDNELQTNDTGIVPFITEESFYEKHPAIILAPQCPENEQWVDTPWADGSYSIDSVPVSYELSVVTKLLFHTMEEYPVDETRIYITGVSMGGYGSWDMLIRNPDLFAAAIILCGAGDPSMASEIKDIPIRFYHGALDEEVPVEGSREMQQALAAAGAEKAEYKEYPDIGHWIWQVVWEEEGLLEWLFEQHK